MAAEAIMGDKTSHLPLQLTLGLVPRGQIRLSSFTAVYSPPKPPPRMHTRGPVPSLAPAAPKPGAAEQATDRARRPEEPLPHPLLPLPLMPTCFAAQVMKKGMWAQITAANST